MEDRKIIAAKELLLRKMHNESARYYLRECEGLVMSYHGLMNSCESILDLLSQLLSLEGLNPSEIAAKILDLADHTDSLGLLKKEIERSLDAFDIKAPEICKGGFSNTG